MRSFSWKKYLPSLGVTLGAVVAALLLLQLDMFRKLELSSLNLRYRLQGRLQEAVPRHAREVVCVAISQQAVSELKERWPWPRVYFARVVDNLKKAGAAAIGIDVVFDVPQADDTLFAQAIRRAGNVVLAGTVVAGQHQSRTVVLPAPLLSAALATGNNAMGLVNMEGDLDGYHRRYIPLTIIPEIGRDRTYHSFALELVRLARFADAATFDVTVADDHLDLNRGACRIPLDQGEDLLIRYSGPPHSFPYYHFDEVLDDSTFTTSMERDMGDQINTCDDFVKDSVFKGKVVIIGAPLAELHDNFLTPFYDEKMEQMPGMEIHANVVQMILDGKYLRRMPGWAQRAMNLLLILVLYVAVLATRKTVGFLTAVGLAVLYAAAVIYLFAGHCLVLDLVGPLVTMFLVFTGNVSYNMVREQRDRRAITDMFAHYVPKMVVDELVRNPGQLTLEGKRENVSVLFSDIEGFTTIAETLPPEQLVVLIREYLTEMTRIVMEHGGIIDKYEGDALMAEFGIPVRQADHALRACAAAVAMQWKLAELRKKWAQEKRPQLVIRIGISTGDMIYGNLGSSQVFDYTVLGDAANLGARLESANKFYGTDILINEDTRRQAGEGILAREIDFIRVKGKSRPVVVFNLIGLRGPDTSSVTYSAIRLFEQGLHAYQARGWDAASTLFAQVLKAWPTDRAAQVFIDRCRELKVTGVPPDWDGVYVMNEK
jgi:adenylate cyclase